MPSSLNEGGPSSLLPPFIPFHGLASLGGGANTNLTTNKSIRTVWSSQSLKQIPQYKPLTHLSSVAGGTGISCTRILLPLWSGCNFGEPPSTPEGLGDHVHPNFCGRPAFPP
ncbi:hypothetical protein CEXT_754581 [Caerostris extrusa]|uniref:Uncharacterized protein n=1 Tax=Caerostris extrusa TaxID=172846 RepID=A0AAV4NSD3_CAEEX|nr:hypothetical protein CEXT_754581 [Caerostris extrusa]